MGRFYKILRTKLNGQGVDSVQDKDLALPPKESSGANQQKEFVPHKTLALHTAKPNELNYWHAYSDNIFFQRFLAEHGLDFYRNVRRFNKLQPGFDLKRHLAIFPVDDNHYYAIQFDDFNTAPVDSSEAEQVMAAIEKQVLAG